MQSIRSWCVGGMALVLAACAADVPPVTLGPLDGHDLAATDLERVAVGAEAPDFVLEAFSGDTVQLSDYRQTSNVVLVFYRGHW